MTEPLRASGYMKIQSDDPVLTRIQDQLAALLNPVLGQLGQRPLWLPVGGPGGPGFLNGWAQTAGASMAASISRDGQWIVRLRGSVTSAAGAAANLPIFTLPQGWRPKATLSFVGNTSVAVGFARIDIDKNGGIYPTAAVAAAAFLTLDGLSFVAEQ